LDANNLYGAAQSELLPVCGFNFLSADELAAFVVMIVAPDSWLGYILDCRMVDFSPTWSGTIIIMWLRQQLPLQRITSESITGSIDPAVIHARRWPAPHSRQRNCNLSDDGLSLASSKRCWRWIMVDVV